ncbi:hypothetical protein PV755_09330 [Streptomyces caniscabiei]|uniref:Uncharacterized protein n=1 Tax=Streptomyces caniscabiei TaxID=2746961 RepID=A0A927QHH9_9ACTN|nr:hypothetical protein [Streptomyces caniscabiei]MBD9721932.1 hypothetical protein [Streptomyces caniscabiei]MDX3509123.1 hypothetical protein [Streptomyces caniscabiei]MDX3717124.1 hypothetical protein [Streptomyces caniscabiei]WEO22991.1 hypothetical protein IHE65_07395 [Streptomyces caniscabiei]
MNTADMIRLIFLGAAAGISVYAAILATLAARRARRSLARAKAATRQAWGDTARSQLAVMKMRNRADRMRR